jgi:Domain of unknown function (DUF4396)
VIVSPTAGGVAEWETRFHGLSRKWPVPYREPLPTGTPYGYIWPTAIEPRRQIMESHHHPGGTTGTTDRAALTRLAVSATLHCLTGCAIGEVLGMVIGTALGWSDGATIALAVVLAFFFGYSLTIAPVLRSGLPLRAAMGVAFAADTLSITVMEIVDNAIMLLVPGAMEAGLTSFLFWGSLAFALLVAFVVTVPVNRWLIARGKGHAVVHQYHH